MKKIKSLQMGNEFMDEEGAKSKVNNKKNSNGKGNVDKDINKSDKNQKSMGERRVVKDNYKTKLNSKVDVVQTNSKRKINSKKSKILSVAKDVESQNKILFLIHLINTFTKKLNIKSNVFYNKVNKLLQKNSSAQYTNKGLVNYQQIVIDYNKALPAGVFVSAKYLSHLGRVLALIYQYGENEIGEKQVVVKLQASFKQTRTKYKSEPSLEGYVPSTNLFTSSSSYPQILLRQMLKFVVNDVIKQQVKLDHSITTGSLTKLSSVKVIEQKIGNVYKEILGPLGDREFAKIKGKVTKQLIIDQISTWKKEGILSEKQADEFEKKIKMIYRLPADKVISSAQTTSQPTDKASFKSVVDFFGVDRVVKDGV